MNREVQRFKSQLIAFSAPSGAGKTTIVKRLAEKYGQIVISISATTRQKRPNEVDGRDYFFRSQESFKKSIEKNKFLEVEEVHGNFYGTLIETVESEYKAGKVVLFDIDVNGALAVKKRYPEAILIFIKPPSESELVKRLKARNSETETSIQKRLQRLELEYAKAERFDHIIINDHFADTIRDVESLILDFKDEQ